MPEGQLIFGAQKPFKSLGGRSRRVLLHRLVQMTAFSLAVAALTTVVANKLLKGFFHFATWHARSGLLTFVLATAQAAIGFCLSYPWICGKRVAARAKWAHLWVGPATVICGFVTIFLATWSFWAEQTYDTWLLMVFRAASVMSAYTYADHTFSKYWHRMKIGADSSKSRVR